MRDKFIQKSKELQNQAATPQEAVKFFDMSCQICCNRGINMDCDKCPIRYHHELVMAAFDDIQEYKQYKIQQIKEIIRINKVVPRYQQTGSKAQIKIEYRQAPKTERTLKFYKGKVDK